MYSPTNNKDLTSTELDEALTVYAQVVMKDAMLRDTMISLWRMRATYKKIKYGWTNRRILRNIQQQEDRIQMMSA